MVARVRGPMGRDAGMARIDFSRMPLAGEESLSFFLPSDCMSLFDCDRQQLPAANQPAGR
jgi:hypothetical protein